MANNAAASADILVPYQQRINQYMERVLPTRDAQPTLLHEAMHYIVFNGGKRIRPALLYLCGLLFTKDMSLLDAPAAAIEFMHCYSLAHDDLPAMDNDDYRRGQPSAHRVYGEAMAMLAGNALQSLAFEIITPQLPQATLILASAAGAQGMMGGQAEDLTIKNDTTPSVQTLERVNQLKTGALFIAASQIGALAGGCDRPDQLEQLSSFAGYLGLAYQAQDDILDADHLSFSSTNQLFQKAEEALNQIKSPSNTLQDLYGWIKTRSH